VASDILVAPDLLLIISEAVVIETSAALAISLIVTRLPPPL